MSDSILESFKVESLGLIRELEAVLGKLETTRGAFPVELMKEFSQKIDRIMGTAQLLSEMNPQHAGLDRIGKIAELCKSIGYKAAQTQETALLPIFSAFWADTLEVITSLVSALEDQAKTRKITQEFSAVLQSRLEWLAKKVAPKPGVQQLDIDALLKQFGG